MSDLLLSAKYKAFLRNRAKVEMLEGTTYAGKTTVGLFKFMLLVAQSPKTLHIIAADDTGTAEKNLINKDLGIMDIFGEPLVEYNGGGSVTYKLPHLVYHTKDGDKIILVLGYGDKKRWKKALGGQYGCLYIDEINTADIEFVREAAMRCDYLMGTLNPDDPSLPVYDEYVNRCRPLPQYAADAPEELNDMLNKEPVAGWVHWFFDFSHNLGASQEKIAQIKQNTPKGTKLWKNKIEGRRGRATGLVFSNFDETRHVISVEDTKKMIRNTALRDQKEWFDIPSTLLPRDPDTGGFLRPNSFDQSFVETEADMTEGAVHKIEVVQPALPHESYLSTYVTALDLALQGVISPSTLGIDVKKLDNAEAQREKEKTTLYTRNKIVSALQKVLPDLISNIFYAYQTFEQAPLKEVDADVPFGEYANPSFESQVETISKAKAGGIMSLEASIDELYGDSKDEEWKAEEVARLKAEQGTADITEPDMEDETDTAGDFNLNMQE